MTLSNDEILEIQSKYRYLINYEDSDPEAPISPLTYIDSNGDTLLHIAAQRGDLETIQALLDAGLDPNVVGDMGCTPLHYAKSKELIDLLVKKGGSLEIENDFGELPENGEF